MNNKFGYSEQCCRWNLKECVPKWKKNVRVKFHWNAISIAVFRFCDFFSLFAAIFRIKWSIQTHIKPEASLWVSHFCVLDLFIDIEKKVSEKKIFFFATLPTQFFALLCIQMAIQSNQSAAHVLGKYEYEWIMNIHHPEDIDSFLFCIWVERTVQIVIRAQ